MQSGWMKEKVEDLVTLLARTVQVDRIYGRNHALTQEAVDSLFKILNDILRQQDNVTLGIIGSEIAFEKEPLYELSARRKQFIEFLKAAGVKKLGFSRGVSKQELMEFSDLLVARTEPLGQKRNLEDMLRQKGLTHVFLGDLGIEEKKVSMASAQDRIHTAVKHDYESSIHLLTQTFQELKSNQPLNVQSARQIVEGLINNLLQNKNLLLILSS
ncbi:MAG TPA: hypothetical protein VGB38_03420, partial [bacterium]